MISIPKPDVICSGGQSGTDLGGLLAAEQLGIATTGYVPRGWRTETGAQLDLGTRFGLVESESADYAVRTRQNVEMCDAVLLICRYFDSPGSKLTAKLAFSMIKALFRVNFEAKWPLSDQIIVADLRKWLVLTRPDALLVAGNRESAAPGIAEFTRKLLLKVFE